VLLVASTGLALGAVYGGFHYATDVLCGLLLGLALFVMAPGVASYLGKMGPGERTGSGDLPEGEAMGPGA
jgi:membrane-associated phospholipid phosphatase